MEAGNRSDGSELVGSLLLIVSGMMLVAAAGELILIFLGLELISIPTYIVLFVGRRTLEGGNRRPSIST